MKKTDCKTCGKQYSPMCDYMQGRCPQHTSIINIASVKTRLTNLVKFFTGKK